MTQVGVKGPVHGRALARLDQHEINSIQEAIVSTLKGPFKLSSGLTSHNYSVATFYMI